MLARCLSLAGEALHLGQPCQAFLSCAGTHHTQFGLSAKLDALRQFNFLLCR
jgi:hypothetical protein